MAEGPILRQLASELASGQDERRPLQVYTSLFRVRRMIWHIWEWNTPWPIPIVPGIGFAAAIFVQLQFGILGLFTHIVGAPLNLLLMLGIAVGVYKLLDQPQVEGRPLGSWLKSQSRYWFVEPRHMDAHGNRLAEPRRTALRVKSWSPRHD